MSESLAIMNRKLLFILFSADACRRNHAFMYALDLTQHGPSVRVILEGEATQCLRARQGRFAELFEQARDLGLIVGACRTASSGCSTGDPQRDVTQLAALEGIELLDSLGGHAGVERYVKDGYEIVTF